MPSFHVCSKSESPVFPHLLNQAPPPAQQLSLPDFFSVPHLGHVLEGVVVAVTVVVVTVVVVAVVAVVLAEGLSVNAWSELPQIKILAIGEHEASIRALVLGMRMCACTWQLV